MGIRLPAHFPAELLAIVWIQRFEVFGPLNAYLWATKNLAELQGIDRNAMRGILLSSHGPENKLLQIMLEEIRRVGAHTCCVINKGCGFHDWVGKLEELASNKAVDFRQVQAISVDLPSTLTDAARWWRSAPTSSIFPMEDKLMSWEARWA